MKGNFNSIGFWLNRFQSHISNRQTDRRTDGQTKRQTDRRVITLISFRKSQFRKKKNTNQNISPTTTTTTNF